MSENHNPSSTASLDFNWPADAAVEGHQYDRVVFENVADQYVKGEDVTAFFTIFQDVNVNPDEDQIGLLRVGTTNIKDCLVYAAVQFNPSTAAGTVRHGTATFPPASLPATDDEFYQFCYILNKGKNLGSSLPFQLNCAPDDIDLLSNAPVRKVKPDGLIALADQDNDDLVVIHTKSGLTEEKLRQENRHLLDVNRRLELEKEEYQTKLQVLESKQKEHSQKVNNDIQTLTAARKAANEEILARQQAEAKLRIEYDACRSLCTQYQSDNAQNTERYRTLEGQQAKLVQEVTQARSQWVAQSDFVKEQATQIVDLERRLADADATMKTSQQRQSTLEREVRDCRMNAEKCQLTMQSQLEDFQHQTGQQVDQIRALEDTNQLLKNELTALRAENEYLAEESNQNKQVIRDLQQQLDLVEEQNQANNELLEKEIEQLRKQLHGNQSGTEAYNILKTSYTEIEKRCFKHQKSELDAKRQMAAYQNMNNASQQEIRDLTERLSAGAEEYRILFRKYVTLEQSIALDREHANAQPLTTNDDLVDEKEVECVKTNGRDERNDFRKEEEEIDDMLRNSDHEVRDMLDDDHEEQQPTRNPSAPPSFNRGDSAVRKCPVCGWEFPGEMNTEGKNQHIESHFT